MSDAQAESPSVEDVIQEMHHTVRDLRELASALAELHARASLCVIGNAFSGLLVMLEHRGAIETGDAVRLVDILERAPATISEPCEIYASAMTHLVEALRHGLKGRERQGAQQAERQNRPALRVVE